MRATSASVVTKTNDNFVHHVVIAVTPTGERRQVYTDVMKHHCQRVANFIGEFGDIPFTLAELGEAAFDKSFD